MTTRRALPATLLLLALGTPAITVASEYVDIEDSEVIKIDQHGTCRWVGNKSGKTIMVPVRTASEWNSGVSSFLAVEHDKLEIRICTDRPNWTEYDDYEYSTCVRDGVEYIGIGNGRERTRYKITNYRSVDGVRTSYSYYRYNWGTWSCDYLGY